MTKVTFKHLLQSSVLYGGVLMLAAACSSDSDLPGDTPDQGKTVTITATQPSSRMAFNETGSGYWQTGDELTVFSESGSTMSTSTFTLTQGDGTSTATFTGNMQGSRLRHAFYPANQNHSEENSDRLLYYLPDTYTYTKVNKDYVVEDGASFSMPMMANFEDDSNVAAFKYLGGMLAIKIDRLPAASGTVIVATDEDEKICGTNVVDNSNEAAPAFSSTFVGGGNKVTFNYSGAKAMSPGVFYLPMPAGEYSSIDIKVSGTGTNGELVSVTTTYEDTESPKTITIERGHIKKLKVNTDYSMEVNGHEMVDLGLPSGLLWAQENLGATNALEAGNYYAWGETTANTHYDGSSYKFSGNTKYYDDGKTQLEDDDDAATQVWGTQFRMPTQADFEELLKYTTQEAEYIDGVYKGYRISSKTNGANIILPATGYKNGAAETAAVDTDYGYYWTSTVSAENNTNAACFKFYSVKVYGVETQGRPYGCAVRAVAEP